MAAMEDWMKNFLIGIVLVVLLAIAIVLLLSNAASSGTEINIPGILS